TSSNIVQTINPGANTSTLVADTNLRQQDETAMELLAKNVVVSAGQYARNVADDIINVLLDISVDDYCSFSSKNDMFMRRLMRLNDNEIVLTLSSLGNDAAEKGDSSIVTSMAMNPSYAKNRSYIRNYSKLVTADEGNGIASSRRINKKASSGDDRKDYHNVNQIYQETENLYHDDDNNTGTFSNKIVVDKMRDSVLFKTKTLFNQQKINTIISRFHTKQTSPSSIGSAVSSYGMSHGRNLLTKAAETVGGTYLVNGYNDPYCRVWTHHKQYDRLHKLIRPFYSEDENGEPEVIKLKDFHNWQNFKPSDGSWGWKYNNDGWDYSVLNDNGFVNITPKYLGGGKSNIHTKQCMFSIENLAWKGFDPYSFEQALSWEQRGPNGGRIMWFAPYGLNFTENVSVNWQPNTFIGRGENVYTYTNTERSGTLSFMLLVDHPSIIDYVSWDDVDHSKGHDTDLLRFFAGCGEGDYSGGTDVEDENYANGKNKGIKDTGSLRYRVTPTPLTDEYTQRTVDGDNDEEKTPEVKAETETNNTVKFSFYVFYPNNYGGYYDRMNNGNNTNVEAMAYLLAGYGAQKVSNPSNSKRPQDDRIQFTSLNSTETGQGYEMWDGNVIGTHDGHEYCAGISMTSEGQFLMESDDNYIRGASTLWESNKKKVYDDSSSKLWYYRIDGKYEYPSDSEIYINTYDQSLLKKENYYDRRSFGLNQNAELVKELFSEEKNETVVSFAEVACALADESVGNIIKDRCDKSCISEDNINLIKEVLTGSEYRISSIHTKGMSNSHANNSNKKTNTQRNTALAKDRADSVKDWLTKLATSLKSVDSDYTDFTPSISVSSSDTTDVSGITAKAYRSAKVEIECAKSQTTLLAETDQMEDGGTDYNKYVGWNYVRTDENGIKYYKSLEEGDDREWYFDEDSGKMIYRANRGIADRSNYGTFRSNKVDNGIGASDGSDDYNKLRYDQEYHFFKLLAKKDPIVFASLMDKVKYFSPAFHSGTPEGFNARLTFLHQCTRQGPTVSASDKNSKSANNLAFGRQPYCVLRLGDFLNIKFIIDNMSVSYDPLVWDLNAEGIGVQPLIANVQLSIRLLGTGDVRGCIAKLANCCSFNFYSNTSLYDNRADFFEIEHDEIKNRTTIKSGGNHHIYSPKMREDDE
ncbi:MAG: hypothetical protein LUD72_12490, partial [Bacteroidales bacterium]|nr:hypothetical protein [Bacteroidales bacterium]